MNELCVLVRYPDGSECFELLADYQRTPALGSYIVHERPKVEPVKCEARGYQVASGERTNAAWWDAVADVTYDNRHNQNVNWAEEWRKMGL